MNTIFDLNFLSVIFIGLSILILVTTQLLPGIKAISLVIAAWFLLPNWGYNLFGIYDIPLFSFYQLALSGILFLKVFSHIIKEKTILPYTESNYILGFSLLLLLQLSFGTLYVGWLYGYTTLVPTSAYWIQISETLAWISFGLMCCCYIKSLKQLNPIILVIILGGVLLIIEYLLTYNISILRNLFGQYSLVKAGRFQSIFLNDYVAVAIWSAVASVCSFYFYQQYKKNYYLLISVGTTLVMFSTLNRAVGVGLIFAMLAYSLIVNIDQKHFKSYAIAMMLLLTLIATLLSNHTALTYLAKKMPNQYYASRIQNLDSDRSTQVRLGQAIRGLQIAMYTFPFGVGPNYERYYLSDEHLPFWTSQQFNIFINYPAIYEGYHRVTYKGVNAEVQIGLISFIVSYGLGGLVFLIFWLSLIFKMAYRLLVNIRVLQATEMRQFATIVAVLTIYFFYFIFNTSPIIYVIFFLFVHTLFLLYKTSENNLSR